MSFQAGTVPRARTIREAPPHYGPCLADIVITSQVDYEPVPGMSAVLEPHTAYAIDGYLAYSSDSATDLRIQLIAPPLAVGTWGAYGIVAVSTSAAGDLAADGVLLQQAGDQQYFTVGGLGAAGSPGKLHCTPHGFIQTGAVGGAAQMTFTQVTSSTSPTTVHAGSWLRVQKVDDVI